MSERVRIPPFSGEHGENLDLFFMRFDSAMKYTREPDYEKIDGVLTEEGAAEREQDRVMLMQGYLRGRALAEVESFSMEYFTSLNKFKAELRKRFPDQRSNEQQIKQDKAWEYWPHLKQEAGVSNEAYVKRTMWLRDHLPSEVHGQLALRFIQGLRDQSQAYAASMRFQQSGVEWDIDAVLDAYKSGYFKRWGNATYAGNEDEDEILGLHRKRTVTLQDPDTLDLDKLNVEDERSPPGRVPESSHREPITQAHMQDWMKKQSEATSAILTVLNRTATTNEQLVSSIRAQQNGLDRVANLLTGANQIRPHVQQTNRIFPIASSDSEAQANATARRLPGPGGNNDFYQNFQPMKGPGARPAGKCFNCGGVGHISTGCTNPPLPFTEQQKLRELWYRSRENLRNEIATGSNVVPLGSRPTVAAAAFNRLSVEESEFDVVEADEEVRVRLEDGRARMARIVDQEWESSGSESDTTERKGTFKVRAMKRARVDRESEPEPDQERDRPAREGTGEAEASQGTEPERRQNGPERNDRSTRKERVGGKDRGGFKLRPKPKMLERVQGMLDQNPFDFHHWLTTTKIEMTVLQYLQESPSARRALGWEMALANPGKRGRRAKRSSEPEVYDFRHCDIQDVRPSTHFGSFYITVCVCVGRSKFVFRKAVLDPGSDLNLITSTAARTVGADLISVRAMNMTGIAMRTADGARHRLKYITEVEFTVESGVWSQEFFLVPVVHETECGFSFLLGLPWLYDAWARFDIRNFAYTIQSDEGELIHLQGKGYKPQKYLSLEYPVQVETKINQQTGAVREKYVYDESSATPSDARSRLLRTAEILDRSGGSEELLGRIPYVDALSYLENYGEFGEGSAEASRWVEDAGGDDAAEAAIGSFLRMSGN
ncbi:hypothetical protein EDC01DRAFT_774684 [Geopyxis carbonaria]|nr:hypothetical protein EDC01DRAFT_774684 [Geopyxis carbonaria]